jgi:hypothetical protein
MTSPLYVNFSDIYPHDLIHIQDDRERAGRIVEYEGTVNYCVLLSVFCRIHYKCKCDTTILCLYYLDWCHFLWVVPSVDRELSDEWMNESYSPKRFKKILNEFLIKWILFIKYKFWAPT